MEMIFTSKKFGKSFRPLYTEIQLVKEPPKINEILRKFSSGNARLQFGIPYRKPEQFVN